MLGGIVKASKGFVSSPLVSTDVMDPEDDPIDSIKKKNEDTKKSVANVFKKKKAQKVVDET